MSFPLVLRDFAGGPESLRRLLEKVSAFHDAAPAAMSFTQAMTNCTADVSGKTSGLESHVDYYY